MGEPGERLAGLKPPERIFLALRPASHGKTVKGLSLKKFAFTLCRNFDEAEDLVQKTYEKALINQKKFLGGNARSWMFSIMRNLFIDSTRRITEELPGDDLQEVPVEGNQLSDIEEEEMQSALERSIDKLTPQEKDVISLIRSDLSIAEISETLNLSNGNVRQIIRRAKIKLCELMDAEQ